MFKRITMAVIVTAILATIVSLGLGTQRLDRYEHIAVVRLAVPEPTEILVWNPETGQALRVSPDFSIDAARDIDNIPDIAVLPFYTPSTPEPTSTVTVESEEPYQIQRQVTEKPLPPTSTGRRIVAQTNDPWILAGVDAHNRLLQDTPECITFSNGIQHCIPVVSVDSPNHPRNLIVAQQDFVDGVLGIERKNGFPMGTMVVSSMIESRWGKITGSHNCNSNGVCCNAGGYCGWFQFGKEAWATYGSGPFSNVYNRALHYEAAANLKRAGLKAMGVDYHSATAFEMYAPHQQGITGARKIQRIAIQGDTDPCYTHKPKCRTNFREMANNIPPSKTKGIAYCANRNKSGWCTAWRANKGKTAVDLAPVWYWYWRMETLGHSSRILPVLLRQQGVDFHYE